MKKTGRSISFEAIARWWRERVGGSVITILGPVEDERGGYESLCHHGLAIRGITLGRLAATIARCSLYVGNDSGISHIAAALGVPTAAVFGPSSVNTVGTSRKDCLGTQTSGAVLSMRCFGDEKLPPS